MAEAVGHYGIFYLIAPSRLSDEKRKKFYSTLREVKSPKHNGGVSAIGRAGYGNSANPGIQTCPAGRKAAELRNI